VLITADNGYELYVNGALVGYDIGPGADVWSSVERWDILRTAWRRGGTCWAFAGFAWAEAAA
jgi:hypothetical protein